VVCCGLVLVWWAHVMGPIGSGLRLITRAAPTHASHDRSHGRVLLSLPVLLTQPVGPLPSGSSQVSPVCAPEVCKRLLGPILPWQALHVPLVVAVVVVMWVHGCTPPQNRLLPGACALQNQACHQPQPQPWQLCVVCVDSQQQNLRGWRCTHLQQGWFGVCGKGGGWVPLQARQLPRRQQSPPL
jgi:hypothetical protein